MNVGEVRAGLEPFVRDTCGNAARIENVVESDGHAGLTFLFDIVEDGGSRTGYVIKLPPAGVRIRRNTDVMRQAVLLRALKTVDLPVPAVPWAFDDNPWFDVPFIVMDKLPGHTYFVWDPDPHLSREPADAHAIWREAVEWLARLHAFDWQARLAHWAGTIDARAQRDALGEHLRAGAGGRMDRRSGADGAAAARHDAGDVSRRARARRLPAGNCLYEGTTLTGIIDWELSGIGAQLLDVGWLCMVSDPANWTDGFMPVHPLPPDEIRDVYEETRGGAFDLVPWYQGARGVPARRDRMPEREAAPQGPAP